MKKFTIIMVTFVILGSIMIQSQIEQAGRNVVNSVVPWVKQVNENIRDITGSVVKDYDWKPALEPDRSLRIEPGKDDQDLDIINKEVPGTTTRPRVIERERVIQRVDGIDRQTADTLEKKGCSCTCN